MADVLDLYHEDYKRFIEYCNECSGTFAIKDYVDEKIKKYKKDNDRMILVLMEHIEKLYPKIWYDPDDPNPFYKWEISNFNDNEHPKNIKNPHIEYLYSYLCFLCDNDKAVNKVLGVEENGLPVGVDNSFNTGLSIKKLTKLFDLLLENEFVEKKDKNSFLKIFSNQPLESIDPIRWLAKYHGGADMQSMFEIIKHLCNWEYKKAPKQMIFFSKINSCFKRFDNKELGISNIETNFSRWDKDNNTTKILKKSDRQDKKFILVSQLQNFFP